MGYADIGGLSWY